MLKLSFIWKHHCLDTQHIHTELLTWLQTIKLLQCLLPTKCRETEKVTLHHICYAKYFQICLWALPYLQYLETFCRFVLRDTHERHVSVWRGCREGSDAHCKASAHLMCWSEKSWQSRGRQVLLMSTAECQNFSKGIYCTWCIYSRVSGHACSRSRTRLRAVGSEEHTFLLLWVKNVFIQCSLIAGTPCWALVHTQSSRLTGVGTALLRNKVGL